MLPHLAARVLLMLSEGIDPRSAIEWVTRKIARNLRAYYQLAIRRAILEAVI